MTIAHRLFVLCGCFAAIILNTRAIDTALESQYHKQPKVHVFEGVVRYNVHKNDFDKGNSQHCTTSPEFEMHYVTWRIRACKGAREGKFFEEYLLVTFEAVFEDKTEEWSCQAEADFKLLPKEPSYNAKSTRFRYFDFDRAHSSPAKKHVVQWDELLNRYMIDDVATIDVTIWVSPPNRIPGVQHTSTKFHMRITDLDTLDELYSDEAVVRGMRWKVLAMKRNDHLSLFVLVDEDDMDLDYSWDVTATFQMNSLDPEKSVSRTFSAIQFDWTRTNYGFNTYMQWTELMDPKNKFVVGNTALLQIELSVAKPKSNPIT